jgi:hypothetical protein
MDTKHLTMIGLGVAGVGTLLTVLYMRNAAASAAAAAAANNSGATPYFQTAALPSSVGGAGSPGLDTSGGGSSLDIAGLIKSLTDSQTASATNSTQLGFAADATALMTSISKLLIGDGTSGGGDLQTAFMAGATKEYGLAQLAASAQNTGDPNASAAALASLADQGPGNNRQDIWGTPYVGAGASGGNRLLGTVSIGGLDAVVNLIADHPNSGGLYLNTPPMAFVRDRNAPVGGSSSQTGNVLGTAAPIAA